MSFKLFPLQYLSFELEIRFKYLNLVKTSGSVKLTLSLTKFTKFLHSETLVTLVQKVESEITSFG